MVMASKFIQLDSIGLDPEQISTEFEGVEKILTDWANRAIDAFRENLSTNGSNATYSLAQGIVPLPVKRYGKDYAIEIEGPGYWKFVEYGVRGRFGSRKAPDSPFQFKDKFPPREPFKKWMAAKGISPREGQTIDEKAREIQHSVYKYGIKKNPFVSPFVTPEEVTKLAIQVADYIAGTNN
jgi:hypothetical protein